MYTPIRAVFVGDGSLLVRCVQAWVQAGHAVVRIASTDPQVLAWAAAQGHATEAVQEVDGADSQPRFAGDDFDVLWSIGWLHRLDEALLGRARQLALNFHDAPLPRRGGLNAPAWALLEGSRHHGVTWHEITPRFDAGRVARAVAFELSPDETAFSLNAHCYETGFQSFLGLVEDLGRGALVLTPQAGPPHLHRRDDRPAGLAVLDWQRPAAELLALVRALDFGHTANPLALPKLWCGGRVLALRRAQALPGAPGAWRPGQVLAKDDRGWQVAAADGLLRVEGLEALDGGPLPSVRPGLLLEPVPDALAQRLAAATPVLARGEVHWRRQLLEAPAVSLPHPRRGLPAGGDGGTPQGGTVGGRAWCDASAGAAHLEVPVSAPAWVAADPRLAASQALAALAGWAAALGGLPRVGVSLLDPVVAQACEGLASFASPWVPVHLDTGRERSAGELQAQAQREITRARHAGPLVRDLRLRLGVPQPPAPLALGLALADASAGELASPGRADPAMPEVCLVASRGARHAALANGHHEGEGSPTLPGESRGPLAWRLRFDPRAWHPDDAHAAAAQLEAWWNGLTDPSARLEDLSLLAPQDQHALRQLQPPVRALPWEGGLWAVVERAGRERPGEEALAWDAGRLTHAALQDQVRHLAASLHARGVGHGAVVGICLPRSPQLVVSVLAVLACGAAYLPLDPQYPRERLQFMCRDAGLHHVIALPEAAVLLGLPSSALVPPWAAAAVPDPRAHARAGSDPAAGDTGATAGPRSEPVPPASPGDLAYVIYTSGSTGQPKGVEVTQGNVINFFAGMDAVLGTGAPGRWLAVTSLSFDISVLELLWTLARGFAVVLHGAEDLAASAAAAGHMSAGPPFSLFYFASGPAAAGADAGDPQARELASRDAESEAYRLLLQGARFADENGFAAVWMPERHFHAFGGPYPNPVVSCAALSTITRRVQLRAGSCVLPLHHPVRVAEDWALVDRLSGGRVGVSFAAGWQPQDFVLAPQAYAQRQRRMFEDIETVRRLWRGEAVPFPGHDGEPVAVRTRPRPLQPELPVWVTAASHPHTFAEAGRAGCHLLTHLLGQTIDELAAKIAAYRAAWVEAGHPGQGQVALMLHAFVGDDEDAVRETARGPLKSYLRSSVDLIRKAAWSFPTFAKRAGDDGVDPIALLESEPLSEAEMEALLDHAFERYWRSSALIGTQERCLAQVRAVQAAGVDEVACLIDFGIPVDTVLAHLQPLRELMQRAQSGGQPAPVARALSVAEAIRRHRITHLQCTPSQASILVADEAGRQALSQLSAMLVGGEALPAPLARLLRTQVPGLVLNMYGPTEATVWATCGPVPPAEALAGPGSFAPLGQPLANVTLHLRTPWDQECPAGVPGELWIGGEGLARGYRGRPELSAQRFPADPRAPGRRLYRTGDFARRLVDGRLEFLGRQDHQVKVRGHRIELGEIEAALMRQPGVREAVVVPVPEGGSAVALRAFVTPREGHAPEPLLLSRALADELPEFMLPRSIALRASFPMTPNGKVDRQALLAGETPPVARGAAVAASAAAPDRDDPAHFEALVSDAWCRVLGREQVPGAVNFFDLGGHSLAAIQVQRLLRQATGHEIAVTEMFRLTTVETLARHLASLSARAASASPASAGLLRAQARRQMRSTHRPA